MPVLMEYRYKQANGVGNMFLFQHMRKMQLEIEFCWKKYVFVCIFRTKQNSGFIYAFPV